MRDVCGDFETGLAEFNGYGHHVHLLVNFPPKVALAGEQPQECVVPASAEGVPGPAAALLAGEPAVARLYFAGSAGGAPISLLRHYIEQQDRPI